MDSVEMRNLVVSGYTLAMCIEVLTQVEPDR